MSSWLFSVVTFGITLVIGIVVAAIIKIIAVAVQRKRKAVASPEADGIKMVSKKAATESSK